MQADWPGVKQGKSQDWTLKVKLPYKKGEVAQLSFEGNPPPFSLNHSNGQTGRAVEVATSWMDESGRLPFPFVLSCDRLKGGWNLMFTRIPAVVGGDVMIEVGPSLKVTNIFLGH